MYYALWFINKSLIFLRENQTILYKKQYFFMLRPRNYLWIPQGLKVPLIVMIATNVLKGEGN